MNEAWLRYETSITYYNLSEIIQCSRVIQSLFILCSKKTKQNFKESDRTTLQNKLQNLPQLMPDWYKTVLYNILSEKLISVNNNNAIFSRFNTSKKCWQAIFPYCVIYYFSWIKYSDNGVAVHCPSLQ